MRSFPISVNSIVNDELPTTPTCSYSDRSNLYHYWTLNDRLRSKNEKLSKRQQSSCCIAFYSLWLCVIASVMIIVVYRYTDECPMTTNQKQFLIKCSRHRLFLTAICLSFLACSGFIFGACRYFRSQPQPFLYNYEHELYVANDNDLLPRTVTSHSYYYPTSLPNGASNIPSLQTNNHDDTYSNTTAIPSVTNIPPQCRIPPFNYDELPSPPSPRIISNASNINNNRIILFSSSTSTLSSPPSILSTTTTSNATNSNKRKAASSFDGVPLSTPTSYTIDIWEKQPRPLSTSR